MKTGQRNQYQMGTVDFVTMYLFTGNNGYNNKINDLIQLIFFKNSAY